MKIGYLGPKGTYCYEAYLQYRKQRLEIEGKEYRSITQTIEALLKEEIEQAILPIENSIQGSVYETMDNLLEKEELSIIGELVLDINHYVLAKQKYKAEQIQQIYSHPQALAQCRKYLQKNFPNAKVRETASTALAAEIIKKEENSCCIANQACKDIYQLEIIDAKIQDKANNQTKFILLEKDKEIEIQEKGKTTMIFSTGNNPGDLYQILGIFNQFSINLVKIESRPAKTKLGEYIFWVDFENPKEEEKGKILIKQIRANTSYCRILGQYQIDK